MYDIRIRARAAAAGSTIVIHADVQTSPGGGGGGSNDSSQLVSQSVRLRAKKSGNWEGAALQKIGKFLTQRQCTIQTAPCYASVSKRERGNLLTYSRNILLPGSSFCASRFDMCARGNILTALRRARAEERGGRRRDPGGGAAAVPAAAARQSAVFGREEARQAAVSGALHGGRTRDGPPPLLVRVAGRRSR